MCVLHDVYVSGLPWPTAINQQQNSKYAYQFEGCLLFEENIFLIILNNSRIVEEIVKRLQVHQDDKRETEII